MSELFEFEISEGYVGLRLDKALAILSPEYSRARLQALIADGDVQLNGAVTTQGSKKTVLGDAIIVQVPDAAAAEPEPEDIPLDIVYEDDDLIVINKQAGLVVHPGAGNLSGTLVNALLHHCGDSLSGIGGVMRPGIVHRLDKNTSGLMVVAKHDKAHQGLAAQLEDRSLSRVYWALVLGAPMPLKGSVNMTIGRDPRNRLKMAVNVRSGKTAKTFYHVLKSYSDRFSLIECKLESGRTHQIRVHMGAMKHPLIGDPLYGPQKTAVHAALKAIDMDAAGQESVLAFGRQMLHAKAIRFLHPVSGEECSFESDLPADISAVLALFE